MIILGIVLGIIGLFFLLLVIKFGRIVVRAFRDERRRIREFNNVRFFEDSNK